jgi:hypothetical protein
MARPKRAKAKARGRISPTEALTIMRTRMAAPRGAMRLTEAVHDWKRRCRLWRDGKLVSRAEVEHLAVQESADDAGQWHASIWDDRWHSVPGEYEFDAEEVWRLLKAPASPSAKPPAPEPEPPRRQPPGPKPKGNWKFRIGTELIRLARFEPAKLEHRDKLVNHMRVLLKREIKWAPKDGKQIAEVIRDYLSRVE